MGVISVKGPQFGQGYSVNISGDTPTPEEQSRINQFVTDQELTMAQRIEEQFGPSTEEIVEEVDPVEQDKIAFARGYEKHPYERQRAFGVSEEYLADTAFGRLFGFDKESALEKQREAEAELARLEAEDPTVGFRDIKGVGTAASFAGEQLGSEARDLAIQTGATLGGGAFGPLGALAGRVAGVGYTTATSAPELFAEAIEKQKEAGGDISLGWAVGATAANMVTEYIVDYFIAGKLLKLVDAGAFKRALVEGGKGAGIEGTQEVSQAVVNRLQAGLPIDSEDALWEYAESFAAGASVGGPFAGGASVIAGRDDVAGRELDEDSIEEAVTGERRIKFADDLEKEIQAKRDESLKDLEEEDLSEPLALPAPSLALPAPNEDNLRMADEEFDSKTFDRAKYERVLQQVKSDITRKLDQDRPDQTQPKQNINIPMIHKAVKKDIPDIKVSQVKDIMTELQGRGFVADNPASKASKQPKYIPMGSLAPETKTPDVSYRRQIDNATSYIDNDKKKLERLTYDLQSVERYGRDLDGNKTTPDKISAEIASTEASIDKSQGRIDVAQQKLQSLGQDTHVPRFEKVGMPSEMKSVPINKATSSQINKAVRPKFEAQKKSIAAAKEQLTSVKKQINKLNTQAKKRQLSSTELNRMDKLQAVQADISTRLGDLQANIKSPEKIIQEVRGEQFREQERLRSLQKKQTAARARNIDDQAQAQVSQGQTPFTPEFTEKQDRVFKSLNGMLKTLGIKEINLERAQQFKTIDAAGAEGIYDPRTKVMSLAMGMYDPNLSDQDLFDQISEVMNHEFIHAIRDLGVLTDAEIKTLENAAEKTSYAKLTKDGVKKRKYTYLDRAKRREPDLTEDQQKEEAIAEMFRDYAAGRLKVVGKPRSLFEKIKKFLKSIVGANVGEGFTSAENIFKGMISGEVGARERPQIVTPRSEPDQSKVSYSRLPRVIGVPTLQEIIKARPYGFTISSSTYGDVTEGFPVAPIKGAEIITGQDLSEEVLLGYLGDNKDISRLMGQEVYLGGWLDESDQQYYLDSSLVLPTLEEALYVAESAEQLAVYDIKGERTVDTNEGIRELKQSGAYRSDIAERYRVRSEEIGSRFKEARLQRNASQREQLTQDASRRGNTDEKYSRVATGVRPESGGNRRGRDQSGTLTPLEGAPNVKGAAGPDENLVSIAEEYARANGIDLRRQSEFVVVDEDRATRIAEAYEEMQHTPQDPVVKEAFRNLIDQTKSQYNALIDNGYEFTFFDSETDPYDENPFNAMRDLRANKRMAVYGTYDGYGTEGVTQGAVDDNPMLQDTGLVWKDQMGIDRPVTANDLFRAVHDAFGHGLEGSGFRARGEENAWQAHVRLFTGSAIPAITTETRGQNSWLNYGPYGETNRTAKLEDTIFAPQKTGLMSPFTWEEGKAGDADALSGGVDKPFYSRTIRLSPEQRAASILDYVDPDTGKPLFKSPQGSRTLIEFANKLLELRGTRAYDVANSEEDQQIVAEIMAAEAEAALLSSNDAIGWYDAKLKLAKKILYQVYPEVSPTRPDGSANPAYDPAAEHAFDYATAVTSNGLSVIDNYLMASRQYESWKSSNSITPKGSNSGDIKKFKVSGSGAQGKSMLKAFEFWNMLSDRGYDSIQISELLTTQMARGDIAKVMMDVFDVDRVADLPFKVDGKELAKEQVGIAYIIGPKIGNGFYQNLRGNFDPLTMDRWWMRFFNRVIGKPNVNYSPELIQKNKDTLWSLVSGDVELSDLDKQLLDRSMEDAGIVILEKSDIELLAPQIMATWDKQFYNKAFNDKLDELAYPMPQPQSALVNYGYRQSLPSLEYAQKKQKAAEGRAKEKGASSSAKKLVDGPQTGFIGTDPEKPLFLDTDFVAGLRGVNDEVVGPSNAKYRAIKKSVEKEGFDPDQKGSTVFIDVNHKGEAFIAEGNNRAAVAKEFGIPSVKAEVRYYNGAEEVDSAVSPQNIIQTPNKGRFDFIVDGGVVRGKDAEIVKEIARAARPDSTPLSLAGKNLTKKLAGGLQEDPRNATDRSAMRATTNIARKILKDKLGIDVTNADFQALMWYAEKRIFESGGVRKGRGDDNDYADGAIALLRKKGISDDKIKNTLPDSERGRLDTVQSQLEPDGEVDRQASGVQRQPVEENFFSPRELEIADASEAPQANLTAEELSETEAVFDGVEIDQEMPRQMYSRVLTRESLMPTRAPVDSDDGSPNPVYGHFMERGKKIPIVLPKGSHRTYDNGHEVGQGLFHIQQRNHDRELFKNSGYGRVENAIFDLLKRWEWQGYDDGDSVIAYPSQGAIVLEWINNRAKNAPPMRLIIKRGADIKDDQGRLPPVPGAFYITTFFPVLEKRNRAKTSQRGRNPYYASNATRGARGSQYSRLSSSTAQPKSTPRFGPSDLEKTMQNLRYTGTQDVIANVLSKLGKPFNVDKKAAEDATQWLFTKLQDNFTSVGKVYDKMRAQGANISRDMDAYFQELRMHGIVGPKKEAFKKDEFTPLIERVANLNVTETEVKSMNRISGYFRQIAEKTENSSHALSNAFVYAKHALERNARISELSKGQIESGSGMSNQEANDIIAFVSGMDTRRRMSLETILAETQGIISGTNDTYIEGGLIPDYKDGQDVDDDTKRAFNKYQFYVPLRGFADPESELDVADYGVGGFGRYGGSKPNRTALGRKSYAGDILANVGTQREAAIDKTEKNKVGLSFLKLLESDDVDTTGVAAEVLERHPLRRVMRNGRITHMPDRDFNDPNEPILAVRRDGKEILIGFSDPRLANAFKGTSVGQSNAFLGGLHSLTRLYANLLTSWNPAFILSNLPRDLETAAFNAQQYNMKGVGKQILKGTPKAFNAVIKEVNGKDGGDPYWRKRYKQFYDNGGQNVLNQMTDEINNSKDIQKTIAAIVDADGKGNKALTKRLWTSTKKGGGSILGYVEALNTAAENSVRLSFFDAVVKNLESQGVPQETALQEAAVAARQLTTNFAKGGEMKYGINSLYLFFNASMQGSMAVLNALVNSKNARKLVASVVVMGFTMDWLNAITSDDEDEDGVVDYDDLGEYKLAHSIVLPDLNGDGTFVTIPMAYGINMFYNFGRSLANLTRGASGYEGTYTPIQAATSTLGPVVETVNPFGGNNFLTFLAPTVLDTPVELLTNKNFMNSPIYKELSPYEQYKSRSGLYWSTTSPTAIGISKFINDTIGRGDDIIPGSVLGKRVDIQPDVIEHVIDFMLGGVGKFVTQVGETAVRSPEMLMNGFEKDMIRRTPLVNKAFTAVTSRDRSGSFYDKRNEVLAIYESLKDARDDNDRVRFMRLRDRYRDIIPIIAPLRNINKQIRNLNKMKRNIMKNVNISDDKRREALAKIEDRKSFFIARGNQLMRGI